MVRARRRAVAQRSVEGVEVDEQHQCRHERKGVCVRGSVGRTDERSCGIRGSAYRGRVCSVAESLDGSAWELGEGRAEEGVTANGPASKTRIVLEKEVGATKKSSLGKRSQTQRRSRPRQVHREGALLAAHDERRWSTERRGQQRSRGSLGRWGATKKEDAAVQRTGTG